MVLHGHLKVLHKRVLQRSYNSVSCIMGVMRVFQVCYMVFIRTLQWCFIGVSIKLQEFYKSDT